MSTILSLPWTHPEIGWQSWSSTKTISRTMLGSWTGSEYRLRSLSTTVQWRHGCSEALTPQSPQVVSSSMSGFRGRSRCDQHKKLISSKYYATLQECTEDEFLCGNGNCISKCRLCDGRQDCPQHETGGGEDEEV